MQNRIISAGIFAVGALFGWAVTADQAALDKKRLEAELVKANVDAAKHALAAQKEILGLKNKIGLDRALVDQGPQPSFKETLERRVPDLKIVQPIEEVDEHQMALDLEIATPHVVHEEKPKTSREIIEEFKQQALSSALKAEDKPKGPIVENIFDKYGDDPVDEREIHDSEDWEEPVTDETVAEARSNLLNLIDRYIPNEEEAENFVRHAAPAVLDKTPPFVISQQTFAYDDEEDGAHYDKITLTWYPGDRVLLDDQDELVEDVAGTVGWKNLSQFGAESNDPDVVFIRNRRMKCDFEVVREEESPLPTHVRYGMDKTEFDTYKASGLIKFRPEDL